MRWHPDKNNADEDQSKKAGAMFRDINEASAVLLDKNKRDKYD